MKYLGNSKLDKQGIEERYRVERSFTNIVGAEFCVYEKYDVKEGHHIARMTLHFRSRKSLGKIRFTRMHIHRLCVDRNYRAQGLASYLISEAIKHAEEQQIEEISTNPSASFVVHNNGLNQKQLESFYKNFRFECGGKEKEIIFTFPCLP
ncbi:MAG: GNAT family N-acetyltransferase [Clostridiales bacterium]|nr:GNAT family N-acetyltransferase [Clostridiales bacterium]